MTIYISQQIKDVSLLFESDRIALKKVLRSCELNARESKAEPSSKEFGILDQMLLP